MHLFLSIPIPSCASEHSRDMYHSLSRSYYWQSVFVIEVKDSFRYVIICQYLRYILVVTLNFHFIAQFIHYFNRKVRLPTDQMTMALSKYKNNYDDAVTFFIVMMKWILYINLLYIFIFTGCSHVRIITYDP